MSRGGDSGSVMNFNRMSQFGIDKHCSTHFWTRTQFQVNQCACCRNSLSKFDFVEPD